MCLFVFGEIIPPLRESLIIDDKERWKTNWEVCLYIGLFVLLSHHIGTLTRFMNDLILYF